MVQMKAHNRQEIIRFCWDLCSGAKCLTKKHSESLNSLLFHPCGTTFSSMPPFSLPNNSNKKSDHSPTCAVIFWQSPRKDYVFLCLSGTCLLFSMCEGKEWAGVPSVVFVGVRLDDMVGERIGFGPLGGKAGRGVKCWCAAGFLH